MFEMQDEGGGHRRLVWLTDLLPQAMAKPIAARVEPAAAVMQLTLVANAAGGV